MVEWSRSLRLLVDASRPLLLPHLDVFDEFFEVLIPSTGPSIVAVRREERNSNAWRDSAVQDVSIISQSSIINQSSITSIKAQQLINAL